MFFSISVSCALISTSSIHSLGLILFSLQHPSNEKNMAAACAASCDPEKSTFFLFKVRGLMERSTGLLSIRNYIPPIVQIVYTCKAWPLL